MSISKEAFFDDTEGQFFQHTRECIEDRPISQDDNNNKNDDISEKLIMSVSEALDWYKSMPEQVFLIPGVKERSFGFVFGPPKSGKTTYQESLFLHIVAGRTEFMGYPLKYTNQKCLFISLEEGAKASRLARMNRQLSEFSEIERQNIADGNNYFISGHSMPSHIMDQSHWDVLEEAIASSGASYVAIDSLNRLTLEKNSDEDVGKRVTKQLRELVAKYPITLFVINHTTKHSNEGVQTVSSMSGSRIYGAEADFLIAVNRTSSNSRYVKLVVSRDGDDSCDTVDKFELTEHQIVRLTEKVSESSLLLELDGRFDDGNRELVLSEINRICTENKSNEISFSDLHFLYEGDTGKFSRQALFDNLKKLTDRRKIEWLSKGKYRLV